MAISKLFLSFVCVVTLFSAATFAADGSKMTDYVVSDYGVFIGDNTNFNGVLRIIKSNDGKITAELSTGKTIESESGYQTVPDLITAVMTLEQTPNGSYKIKEVVMKDKSYGADVIFKTGGIINPNGQNDFGGRELQYSKTETSYPVVSTMFEQIDR